jgi:GH15 family glucan-1,4-alpha-glucosidase
MTGLFQRACEDKMLSKNWRTLQINEYAKTYRPIADYAIIGDQKTCALVGMDGSIDWMCVPRFDSPSIFGALLDVCKGGSFKILPKSTEFESRQYYDGPTNILLTEFRNQSGQVRITDFMPCFKASGLVVSTGEVHRRVSCIRGRFDLELKLEPRLNYGFNTPIISKVGKFGYSIVPKENESGHELGFIASLENLEMETEGRLVGSFSLERDQKLDLVLRFGALRNHHSQITYTDEKLAETKNYWRNLSLRCKYRGKWRDHVLRSALLLHLLVYSPTGAIIAAPTTSLPEEIGGDRNWDYRYSWIRDSSFALRALSLIGDYADQNFVNWLTSTFYLTIDNLQVMLGINGELDLDEKTLPYLEGYMGSSPVRVGNGAWNQFQLDLYGILLDTLYFSHKHNRVLSRKLYAHIVQPIVKLVEQNWQKPDCGMWEVREERKHFTYSKVWCWVALDRAVKIASLLGFVDDVESYTKLRDLIRDTILEKGWDPESKSFVRSFGSTELDAANLLMPQVGFIDGKDPRMISTIEQTKAHLLVEGKFLYRYKSEDGLPDDEGAFLMCSFWLVSCLALAGMIGEAEKLLESLLDCSNHVGLFSEEIDPRTNAFLGNFPQGFTHIGLISAVTDLERCKTQMNL